jgi:multidrug resistance efflux pump
VAHHDLARHTQRCQRLALEGVGIDRGVAGQVQFHVHQGSGEVLDGRETTFNTTKARLEQARAQAQVARNQSSYTTLVAEADGVITAVNVEQ